MRQFSNFIEAYMDYAQFSEAPAKMHFWTGVSILAATLKRKVWIDQVYYQWYPNFFILFVAPPGVVNKSTTITIGMDLLKEVPGITMGPEIVTWPSLIQCFGAAQEGFSYGEETHTMSALTFAASELGNFLNPQDKQMVDLLVDLWDGRTGTFRKSTKNSGNDSVVNPWINLIACTTPAWIAGNFPEYMVGGGFTSRCVFVYASDKEKFVAYPSEHIPSGLRKLRKGLVEELCYVGETLRGPFTLSSEAAAWGNAWYKYHHTARPVDLDDDRFGGYIARKQTHVHKLAMVLSAAEGDSRVITESHLRVATEKVTELETDMAKVFGRIGKTPVSVYADRLIDYVRRKKVVTYRDLYRYSHTNFPSLRDFEDIMAGAIKAGFIKTEHTGDTLLIKVGNV